MSSASSSTNTANPQKRSAFLRVLPAFVMPLFFIVLFPLAFASAIHAPAPNDLALKIVGPAQVVTPITKHFDTSADFAATQTDVASEARSSVERREVTGAIQITPLRADTSPKEPTAPAATSTAADQQSSDAQQQFTVTTYIANGGGLPSASAVQAAGDQVAEQLGTTAKTVDVAPLSKKDSVGTSLFYLLVYSSLAGYLVIIVLMQVAPKAKLATRFAVIGGSAVIAPVLAFALASIFVGDYGASFGTIVGVLAIDALYVFTVGNIAILAQQFLGNAATIAIMGLVVFLNFPSGGGAIPRDMLPAFWQHVHDTYFGAGAYESFRSLIYFDGNGVDRWLPQLAAWTVGLLLVNLVVHLTKTTRRQQRELHELRPAPMEHRHLVVEPAARPAPQSIQQSALTAEEATR